MLTFDGRVGMCCHDWGAQHGVGFIDSMAFDQSKLTNEVQKKISNNSKGFELLKNAKKPKNYNEPSHKVESLNDIWNGKEISKVRTDHLNGNVNKVNVCKSSTNLVILPFLKYVEFSFFFKISLLSISKNSISLKPN